MTRIAVVVLVAVAVGAGCVRDPVAGFNEARIEAVCGWYERCGTLENGGYQSITDCRSELAAASKAETTNMNCDDFSQAESEACIAAWDDADCDLPPDLTACEDVCSN